MTSAAAVCDLAELLQREHALLDAVRFRFVETRLLLEAGEERYLARATAEVGEARSLACEVDLLRAASVHRSGVSGGGRTPTLLALAAAAPRPWDGILVDHREGMCATVAEIEAVGAANAHLARAGISAAAEALDILLSSDRVPSPLRAVEDGAGSVISLVSPRTDLASEDARRDEMELSLLVAERTYQDVITTAARLRMPALRRFLQ